MPLGALFGAQGSLNDFKGAALGRRQKTCSYGDQPLKLPRYSHTGKGTHNLFYGQRVLQCAEISKLAEFLL